MLVAFALKNYACYRDRAELSLEAGRSARDDGSCTFGSGNGRYPRLSRVAAVYGANGSGKSRFIQALAFVQHFVTASAKGRQAGEKIPHTPFLFEVESRRQPSTFEISFIEEGTAYELGFTIDRESVLEEWLFAWPPGGRLRRLLERKRSADGASETWRFSSFVTGPKQTWRASTRPNALFTSTAAQLNSDVFRPVVEWFQRLRVVGAGQVDTAYTVARAEASNRDRLRILALLRDAGIAVSGFSFERAMLPLDAVREHVPPSLVSQLAAVGKTDFERWITHFAHSPPGSEKQHFLDLDDESDGTRRLFALAGPWLDVLDNNLIVVIDELDRSLHPHLIASLVHRVNSAPPGDAPRRAQLILTTHDVTLLQDVLDRSQVWFTEKDRSEATTLIPLSDFRPRRDESLIRGYLGGRYGGVPVVTESELAS